MPNETEKVIAVTADGRLLAKSPLLLIERKSGPVWVMNQLFIAPAAPADVMDQVMEEVKQVCQATGLKVWPLDPKAIAYFQSHQEFANIWAGQPAN
ncbi:hypothetical protein lacNasYZ03_13630 [Lactobacillus nasalidis]|uniref:Acetyltransferase n=1 Tax=Lactobacillus nasalidis TaxID=2797258 RepID=A0ABQ3W5E0_9LACO|nr:hypothetical protein [Lactobacillus nasalidis]GHV96995.1 hypothetical protein lacNasYZ01_01770 [Lactobacillus nasalidis]GHV99618.1 hypothetical protein lacNasYZ02_10480 [Lactobacillus nasalidis]GHW01676.1 hypothetical protein lacNasYZ03_13630 [Lactobacillus nasalidis]